MFLRAPYNYDTDAASDEAALLCGDVSLAVQASKEECDINVIVKRFGLTGQLPQVIKLPTYGDFTGIITFKDAMNAITEANRSFESLPADIRGRFLNDPALFVDFCSDEKNKAELETMGLLKPVVNTEPAPAPSVVQASDLPATVPGQTLPVHPEPIVI